MTDERTADLVRRAHEGELLGEGLFAELVRCEDDADHRTKLRACELLEAQTRLQIESLARDLGVDLGPRDEHVEAGRRAAAGLAAMDWTARMAAVAGGTSGYRSLYADLRAGAPDPSHPVLDAIVRHEEALHDFTTAEAAGDAHALDLLVAALDDDHRALLA